MPEIAMLSAAEWARAHAPDNSDPVEFGHKVALVWIACDVALNNRGDEKATAAALAALSIPLEVLQRLEQVSSLLSRPSAPPVSQTNSAGA